MINAFFFFLVFISPFQQDIQLKIKLPEVWRFEIGDNPDFAALDFDDSQWSKIKVPSPWENAGFPGYDGYAWYRVKFYLPADLKIENLVLKLGCIDDIDEVYLNGQFIARSGQFPPNYKTAWDQQRSYTLPENLLRRGGLNLLAIRVFDYTITGGIYQGPIGIFQQPRKLNFKINLAGPWKFSRGDSVAWKEKNCPDENWQTVELPCEKEIKNRENPVGIAWYRKKIKIHSSLAQEQLILILGKIRDHHSVYFNGKVIGKTAADEKIPGTSASSDPNTIRYYSLPADLIQYDQLNTIAVRVSTLIRKGGIYRGPIGITTASILRHFRQKE